MQQVRSEIELALFDFSIPTLPRVFTWAALRPKIVLSRLKPLIDF